MKEIKIETLKGYEDCIGYTITKDGTVRSYKTRGNQFVKPKVDWTIKPKKLSKATKSNGYYHVSLASKSGKSKYPTIHRLLALAFIPNTNDLTAVNHINGDKKDNSLSNLEWVSYSDNMKHAFKTGLNYHTTKVKVDQFDKNDNFIKTHNSIAEAIEFIGLKKSSKSAITRVCRGSQKTCGGFIWKYHERAKGSTTISNESTT